MDNKVRHICMLPIRDPSQNETHTQTEGKGMKKIISCTWKV